MNGLQVFNYHNREVRTVEKDGAPWWVLKDVCVALDLKAPARVAARLDEDEKGVRILNTLGGPQEATIINEPGLYTVILRSNKPEAKAFKRWITHEVLPSIRKTGAFVPQDANAMALQTLERLTGCMEAIAGQFGALVGRVEALENRAQRSSPAVLTAAQEGQGATIPGKAARRRWMRTLNEKLDLLEERFEGATRLEILHKLYQFIEEQCDIVLDEERIKTIERLGLEDCSVLEAIYYSEPFKSKMERNIDCNLAPENRGW